MNKKGVPKQERQRLASELSGLRKTKNEQTDKQKQKDQLRFVIVSWVPERGYCRSPLSLAFQRW